MRKKISLFLFIIAFLWGAVSVYYEIKRTHVRKQNWLVLEETLKTRVANFKGEAGIVVKDLRTGWKISFNEKELFPAASVVKIPVMLACLQAQKEKKLNLKEKVELKSSYKVSGSGILKDTPVGSVFTIEKLIELMICNSDNTATNILINRLGFDYLNRYFKKVGLKNTNLSRKMMDFENRHNGVENYTTPEDMAYLLEMLYRKRIISRAASQNCLNLLKRQKIKDRIPARLPASAVVAHKTGLEYRVCHDTGIVFTSKGDLLICALTKHAKSNRAAKRFISKVALDVYNYSFFVKTEI